MSAWARPGVKCVCVDGRPWLDDFDNPTTGPALNEVLTVATHPFLDRGLVCIRFEEWPGPEEIFVVESFRPLVRKSQSEDVALIKSLLVGDEVSA